MGVAGPLNVAVADVGVTSNIFETIVGPKMW